MQIIDAVHGIEWRAVRSADHRGWKAQWRPLRAMSSFPGFSFISRSELFPSEGEALAFMKENAESIVARKL
jgi:hypothetical protein